MERNKTTMTLGIWIGLWALSSAACVSGYTELKQLSPRFERAAKWTDARPMTRAAARPSSGRLALAIELAWEVGESERPQDSAFREALRKGRVAPTSEVPTAAMSALAHFYDAIELDQVLPPGRCNQLEPMELAGLPTLLTTARAPTDAANLRAQIWYALRLAEARPSAAHMHVALDTMKGALETARREQLCLWNDASQRPSMAPSVPLTAYAREVRCTAQMFASDLVEIEAGPARSLTTSMVNDYIAYHERVFDRLMASPGEHAAIFAEVADPGEAPELVKVTAPSSMAHLPALATEVERLMALVTCDDASHDFDVAALHEALTAAHGAKVVEEMSINAIIAPSSLGGVRVFGLGRHHWLGGGKLVSGDRVLAVDGQPMHTRGALLKAIHSAGARGAVLSVMRDGRALEVRVSASWSQEGAALVDADPDASPNLGEPPADEALGEASSHAWVRKTGLYDYTVEEGPLRAAARHDRETKAARVVPHYKDNQYQGFKLVGVRPGSVYRALGLRSGDVIIALDGEAVSSPDKALEFFERLERASGSMTIDLERRGEPKRFRYTIVASP